MKGFLTVLRMIMLSAQRWDLIRFGYHARRALDILAAQFDALPVAGILDLAIQCKRFPIDREQIIAPIAAGKAYVQMIEALFLSGLSFRRGQLYLIAPDLGGICKRAKLTDQSRHQLTGGDEGREDFTEPSLVWFNKI